MIFLRPLTIVFGALPASWLAIFAGMGVYLGGLALIEFVTTGSIGGLLLAIFAASWGALGLYGAISLWAVGLGFAGDLWRQGLKAGIIAASPVLLSLVIFGGFDMSALAAILAIFVAVFWLVELPDQPESPIDGDGIERDLDELRQRGTSW